MSFVEFMENQGFGEQLATMPLMTFKRYLDNWKKAYDKR
jgi:hypothetical protein